MKILMCTKRDLVGNMMLNRLLPALSDQHQIEVMLANSIRPENSCVPELVWLKHLFHRLLLTLGTMGSLADWLIVRRIETSLTLQTAAIVGMYAAENNTLTGPLATGLAALEKLEHELAIADRLDNLN